jgi:hypothetical protein
MAVFTSKAGGNWNAGGSTTWNQAGVPGYGDTVTITNAVVVSSNASVGTGSGFAIALGVGGTLEIAAGITLTVYSNINDQTLITLDAGAILQFAFVANALATDPPFALSQPQNLLTFSFD